MGYIDEEYLDYLMEAEQAETPAAGNERPPRKEGPPVKKRKKKKHWLRWLIIIAILVGAVVFLMGRQPVRAMDGERIDGVSTILIAGTDKAGLRTDTLLLLSINSKKGTANILSIPRDTYCEGYKTPKINAVNAVYGGGAEGMEELMRRLSEITGFMPDGYVLVDLDAFVKVVDLFGGVDFEVPVDMDYEDPYQDLYIHLKEGYQHLDGEKAIQLVRFRKGYAQQDLQRVSVQRDFIKSAMEQWLTIGSVAKVPGLFEIMEEDVFTDLTMENILWIGRTLLFSDLEAMESHTLPGEAANINGGSYFVVDKDETARLMEIYSPCK